MNPADAGRTAPTLEGAAPGAHRAQRSLYAAATVAATAVVFLLGLANPTISAEVGVTLAQGELVVAVFLAAVILAFLSFHRFGPTSRWYRYCDHVEGFTLSWAVAYLIRASNGVHPFFWIFHGIQVLATALAGYAPVYAITVAVGPTYLVASFLLDGRTAPAWVSAIAGVSGIFMYLMVARLSDERAAALRREAALREELGRVLVVRERERISQDLHDNVATELTALVWHVREISAAVPGGPQALDIAGVAERLRSVIADLRNVVLSLRSPALGFRELELMLERRCRELCGNARLVLNIDGRLAPDELGVFYDHVLPICFELVNNAGRHAEARQVELALQMGARLQLWVTDDGRGLAPDTLKNSRGGLGGIRRRVEGLGGSVSVEARAPGTRVVVDLPRPLRSESASA